MRIEVDNEVSSTTSSVATSEEAALSAIGYALVGPRPAWPPLIPPDVQFYPVGRLSAFEALEVKSTYEVLIRQDAYNKMMFWVQEAPGEISGFGRVVRKGNFFMIEDVFLLDQVNTAASSRITEETLDKMMRRLRKKGMDTVGWDCHWHSHVNMPVFYSVDDERTIEELRNQRYTISIVTNKRLDLRCRIDFYQPARFAIDRVAVKPFPHVSDEERAAFQAQMAESVRYKTRGGK